MMYASWVLFGCTLGIFGCHRLKLLFQRIGSLANLRTLVVSDCNNLIALTNSLAEVPALETLEIFGCKELSLTEGELLNTSLQKLKITNVPKLEVLPWWLGSSKTLQYLHISMCQNLAPLPRWLPSLKSLQTLEIFDCYKLTSLPEGMDRLTALKELKILYCNELIQKCKEEDRSKIAHIPTVTLVRFHSLTFQHHSLIPFVYSSYFCLFFDSFVLILSLHICLCIVVSIGKTRSKFWWGWCCKIIENL
jgi:hypothetical protein